MLLGAGKRFFVYNHKSLTLKPEMRIIRPSEKQRGFPWLILGLIGFGLGMSIAFIYLSDLWPRQRAVSASDAIPSISSPSLATAMFSSTNTPASEPPVIFQVLPTPDQTALSSLTIGQLAPDFTLNDLEGRKIVLSDFRGQVVLINFWASWCQPCRIETPELVKAYETYRNQGVMILGINLTDEDAMPDIEAFVKEFNVSYPVLLDTEGVVDGLYNVPGIPMSIFIDREGKIYRVQLGALSGEQIETSVSELLKPQ